MNDETYIRVGQTFRFTGFFKAWSSSWVAAPLVVVFFAPSCLLFVVFAWTADRIVEIFGPEFLRACGPVFAGFLVANALASVGLVVLLLPTVFRNRLIESWFRDVRDGYERDGCECFVVDLSPRPRLVRNPLFALEDDDVGLLNLTEDGLIYVGDSIEMRIPWGAVDSVTQNRSNTGLKYLWLTGQDLCVRLKSALDGRDRFLVRSREGRTLFHVRRRNAELARALGHRIEIQSMGPRR